MLRSRLKKICALASTAGLALVAVTVVGAAQPALAADNGLARTPPMGWNGYNRFSRDVTASLVEAEARALVTSGMKAAGYDYVNLDGGWDLLQRGPDGQLQPDPAKFPDGIKSVAEYVHSLGLEFGIYTTVGTKNCAGTSAGSYGHYQQDIDTFASWGVDYVKVDWCAVPTSQFPGMSARQIAEQLYGQFARALRQSPRPMVYSLSTNRPTLEAWDWAPPEGNLWRTNNDLADRYPTVVTNFAENAKHYAAAGPGAWNDPDMLEVGNGGMTPTEDRTQFSLWAEMAAPLIAGNDLSTMTPQTQRLLTNRDVIAVDQDPLGEQGVPVAQADGHWVLSKPLANGDRAVVLFNQTDKTALISTTAKAAGLPPAPRYRLDDLWQHTVTESRDVISAAVPPHAVALYRVGALHRPAAAADCVTSLYAQQNSLAPGATATLTQTFTDNGSRPAQDVELRLLAPAGWAIAPAAPATARAVPPGATITRTWQVTVPAGVLPVEAATLYASASYAAPGAGRTSTPGYPLQMEVLDPDAATVPQAAMSATATSAQRGHAADEAIDGDPNTYWHSEYSPDKALAPQSITLDLGGRYDVAGLGYLPRQDAQLNGTIFSYRVYVSSDGTTFRQVAAGNWLDSPSAKSVRFDAPDVRFVRLEGLGGVNQNVSAAELQVGATPAAI